MGIGSQVGNIDIRFAVPSDAERLLELKLVLDHETNFMMYEPGERQSRVDEVRHDIRQRVDSSNSALIIAASSELIAGYVEAAGGEFNRTRHLAMVVAGVRASYAGQGVGSRLFEALVAWADSARILRLELTVMAHNKAAIALYEKFGFVSEGVRRCSVVVDGKCVDELAMARLAEDFAERGQNG
jgi:RimJ/RimL family protein N-acetyltransferase